MSENEVEEAAKKLREIAKKLIDEVPVNRLENLVDLMKAELMSEVPFVEPTIVDIEDTEEEVATKAGVPIGEGQVTMLMLEGMMDEIFEYLSGLLNKKFT